MNPAAEIAIRTVLIGLGLIAAVFAVVWAIGRVAARIAKRREAREFALDDAQDFDDPEVRTFTCTQPECTICAWFARRGYGDTPFVEFKRTLLTDPSDEVTDDEVEQRLAQFHAELRGREIRQLDQAGDEAPLLETYPAWMRRLDQRRAETGSILDGIPRQREAS